MVTVTTCHAFPVCACWGIFLALYVSVSCSSQFVAEPVVVKQNSSGQTSLQTRTERYVGLSVHVNCANKIRNRTILAIVSMRQQVVGRRIKMFIGTTEISNQMRRKGQRKSER